MPVPTSHAPPYAPPTLAPALAAARQALGQQQNGGEGGSRPTLFVVMGTSGSGKSTLGSALATSLRCPFVDGDDLHPPSNVRKMASGVALDDADRLPWLRLVREKAVQLTRGEGEGRERSAEDRPTREEAERRALAEVRETSALGEAEAKAPPAAAAASTTASSSSSAAPAHNSRVVVIACSALKRSYRDVLRGSSSSAADELQVFHIYLRVSASELQRRMRTRGAHFMKPDMLASQLATLEEPADDEQGVFVVDDAPHDAEEVRQAAATTTTSDALRMHSVEARFTIACPPGADVAHLPTQGSRSSIVAYPLPLSTQQAAAAQPKGHGQHLAAISRALGEVREAINAELTRQKDRLGKQDFVGEEKAEKEEEDEEGEDEEEESESE